MQHNDLSILCNDYYSKFSWHSSPYIVTFIFYPLWWELFSNLQIYHTAVLTMAVTLYVTSNVYFSILLHVQCKMAGGLCSSQSLWCLGWWRCHRLNTISTWGEGSMESHTPALKCFCPELTWMIFAQISLDRATHMATSNTKEAEMLGLFCVSGKRGDVSEHC